MISEQLSNIKEVLNTFKGINGEPKGGVERYILKASWVMVCAEFEGCLKEIVRNYIDQIKNIEDLKQIHPCLIAKSEFGNGNFNIGKLITIFKEGQNKISHKNILVDNATLYRMHPIRQLFDSMGIFLSDEERSQMKLLDGIAKTRDSIAHGDRAVEITRKELEANITKITDIYHLLESKLSLCVN